MPVICDFCSDPEVKWHFAANDVEVVFVMEGTTFHQLNEGGWASCDICHDLIIDGKKAELLERSVETFLKLHGKNLSEYEKKLIRPMIRVIQAGFWENSNGICQRVLIAEFKTKGGENL